MSIRPLIRENRGAVAVLTLNRPERRNALSRALLAQLRDAVDDVGVDVGIRAVVLTGAGVAFSTGMDLKEAAEMHATPDGEHAMVAVLKEFADLLQCIHTLPKPVIAAVNGDALAGGAGLMAACDLAVAAETARIGYPEVRRGLVAAIVMHDLTRQVGDRRARQLLLTGDLISSKLAHDWGLVNAVTPPERCLDEAIRMAQGLIESAHRPPWRRPSGCWTRPRAGRRTSGAPRRSVPSSGPPRKPMKASAHSSRNGRHDGPPRRRASHRSKDIRDSRFEIPSPACGRYDFESHRSRSFMGIWNSGIWN